MSSYPAKEGMRSLFENLCAKPTVSDFKLALRIFRFAPEAKTPTEIEIINMLDLGLILAKQNLYLSRPSWSLKDMLKYYLFKLIPSLSLFYMLRITLTNNTFGLM